MDSYRNKVPMLQFPIRLDLGAGAYPKEGFVRLDFDPVGGQTDVVWDIAAAGIPLPDNSVCELFSSHFLEHLTACDYHHTLQEIWRVCANGALVVLKVPHGSTPEGALPCHYQKLVEDDMRAIGQWFPPPGHHEHNGNYWNLQSVERDGYHLIGTYLIVKS